MGVLTNCSVGDLGSIKFLTGAHSTLLSGSEVGGSLLWNTSLRLVPVFPITWNTEYDSCQLCKMLTLKYHLGQVKRYIRLQPPRADMQVCNQQKNHPVSSLRPLTIIKTGFIFSDKLHLCFNMFRHTATFQHCQIHVEHLLHTELMFIKPRVEAAAVSD